MSVEEIRSKGKIRRIYRRRKMTIFEEEEEIVEEMREEPSANFFRAVDVSEMPLTFMSGPKPDNSLMEEFDDIEERKELARVVGLSDVPKKKIESFDTIFGMFDNIAKENESDAVEMIKTLRRRC